MTRQRRSFPASFFDELYAANPDPWQFATSDYEKQKYRETVAALPREDYVSAFEVGCSIGVLTGILAARCNQLLAVDVADRALADARVRCAAQRNVTFARMRVPEDWPTESFDLIIFSEVLYYVDPGAMPVLASRVERSLLPDGDIILVNWTGDKEHPAEKNHAADEFMTAAEGFTRLIRRERATYYRLEVLRRR